MTTLNEPAQRAVTDIAKWRGLGRTPTGYGNDEVAHSVTVIEALAALGLCRIRSHGVVPTEAGWRLAKAALKDTPDRLGVFPSFLR